MKKTLKIALACALGASLVFVGCTKDFSSDINKLDSRVTALESVDAATRLATLESNVASLQSALTAANTAIDANKAKIAEIEKNYATTASVDAKIKALESVYATQTSLQATRTEIMKALADAQAGLEKSIAAVDGKADANAAAIAANASAIEAAKKAIEDLQAKKADKAELKAAEDKLQAAIDASQKALEEKIEAAKAELKAHSDAEDKKLNDKIDACKAALDAADAKLQQDIDDVNEAVNLLKADVEILKAEVDALENRMDDAESDIQANVEAIQANSALIAENTEAIKDIEKNINEIEKRLGIVETKVEALGARVQTITAAPCKPEDFAEVVPIEFGSIDTSIVKMNFKVTPAEAAKKLEGKTKLVVTCGLTRAAGIEQYYEEYVPEEFEVGTDGIVTVIAKVSPIEAPETNAPTAEISKLAYWISLSYTETDEAGDVEIISDPVAAIVGKPLTLDVDNLTWCYNGKEVKEYDGEELDEAYQVKKSDGPILFTDVENTDYTLLDEGKLTFPDVYAGYDIRVKDVSKASAVKALTKWYWGEAKEIITLGELQKLTGAADTDVAVSYPVAAPQVFAPAESWTEAYDAKNPATDSKDIYACERKDFVLDVTLDWVPATLYDITKDINLLHNRYDAVGTSLAYTVGLDPMSLVPATASKAKNGIIIGGVRYKTLMAIYRARLDKHEDATKEAVKLGETVKWDYINYAQTNGGYAIEESTIISTPENANAFFANKTWLGSISELNRFSSVLGKSFLLGTIVDGKGKEMPASAIIFNKDSQKIVDLGITGVTYKDEDQNLIAQWGEYNKNTAGVTYNAYLTQIPFTVTKKHPAMTAKVESNAGLNRTAGGDIVFEKAIESLINSKDNTWIGSLDKKVKDAQVAFIKEAAFTVKSVEIVKADGKKGNPNECNTAKEYFSLTFDGAVNTFGNATFHYVGGQLHYDWTYTVMFTAKVFDVDFTYVVTYKAAKPAYKLATTAYVVNGTAPLEGQVANVSTSGTVWAYDIQDAHFSKYLRVVGCDNTTCDNEKLTVKIEYTPENASGKVDIQVPEGGAKVLSNPNDKTQGYIEESNLAVWNRNYFTNPLATTANYTGHSIKVKATLCDDGEEINHIEFTLSIEDPIKFEVETQNVVRVSAEDKTINVLQNVKVIGTLPANVGGEVNVLNPNSDLFVNGPHWNVNSQRQPSYGQYQVANASWENFNNYAFQQLDASKTPFIINWSKMTVTLNGEKHSFTPEEATWSGCNITLKKDNCKGKLVITVPLELKTAYGVKRADAIIVATQGEVPTE